MTRTESRSPASRGPLGALVLCFTFLLLLPSAALAVHMSDSGGPEAARIATARGGVFVRGNTQGDWGYADPNLVLEEGDEVLAGSDGDLTLEFPGSVFVTLAQGSRLQIEAFRPGLHLRLRYGTFHVVLLEDLHGYERARMEWPRGSVYLEERGCYRADVFRDGLARVAALRGEAIVSASGGRSILGAGESVYVEPGGLPTDETGYVAGDYDTYDRYVLDRYYSPRWPALPPFLAGYGGAVGLRDLSRYGQWIYVPALRSYAWRPRGVARSWRPYRDGRWVFTRFGWTWVPRESWGYAPSHYGRWGYVPRYGWLWTPGRQFAPAWVRWGQAGDAVGWSVIGPNDRIVAPPAAIYGSPYVFMAANEFKAGKPVKLVEPKVKPHEITLVDDPAVTLRPEPEAKIKAPRLKPGHPAPADQAAEREEQIAFKQSEQTQREAEHAARAMGKADRRKEKGSTEDVAAPVVKTPGAKAPAEVPARAEEAPAEIPKPAPSEEPVLPSKGKKHSRKETAPSSPSVISPPEAPAEIPEPAPGEEPVLSSKGKKHSRKETAPSSPPVMAPREAPPPDSPPPPSPGVTPPSSSEEPSASTAPAPGTPAPGVDSGSTEKEGDKKHGPKKKVPDEPE